MIQKYILIGLAIGFFMACSENTPKPEIVEEIPASEEPIELTIPEPDESVQVQKIKVNQDVDIDQDHVNKKSDLDTKLIEPKLLEKYTPERLKYFQTIPGNYGSSYEGLAFTSVIAEYIGTKGGYIQIAIFDYGFGTEFTEKIYFNKLPFEPGFTASLVKCDFGPAYKMWHDVKKSGKIRALIADRYYVKIDVTYLSPEIITLEGIFEKVNLKELNKLK